MAKPLFFSAADLSVFAMLSKPLGLWCLLTQFFLWLTGQFFTDPCPLSALLPPSIPQPPNAHTSCPLHGLLHVSRRPWWWVFWLLLGVAWPKCSAGHLQALATSRGQGAVLNDCCSGFSFALRDAWCPGAEAFLRGWAIILYRLAWTVCPDTDLICSKSPLPQFLKEAYDKLS